MIKNLHDQVRASQSWWRNRKDKRRARLRRLLLAEHNLKCLVFANVLWAIFAVLLLLALLLRGAR